MPKAARLQFIRRIEAVRRTQVITYITSTRPNLEVQMSMDCIRKIYEHLAAGGDAKRDIDLFIHSNGGDGTVPWRLVTLIREYAKKFNVLVPHRAFSAATLTALGADTIVMHPMGMLGPTDPTVANAFNPRDATNQNPLGISVEDVTAYIALIKEDAGIQHEDELIQAFKLLAEKVHPLALGNVKRSLSQSHMMAKKLLSLHMDASTEAHKIDEIVDNLTSKLYYHGHPINRIEAKSQVGLANVVNPPSRVEKAMWGLYLEYEQEMKMEEAFRPEMEFLAHFPNLKPNDPKITPATKVPLVFVESKDRSDSFELEYEISGAKDANGITNMNVIQKNQKWLVI